MPYSYVREALALFSPDYGLDVETAREVFLRQLRSAEWKSNIAAELAAMLEDNELNWVSVVCNEEFEMGEFKSSEQARTYVINLLFDYLLSE